jgi:hypothetical protein
VKKAIVILLLVLYSASTIGATINMHYCMDKFAGFSFSNTKKEKCAKCGMTNTGCCKDEKKQIKLTLDQQKAEYNQNINAQAVTLIKPPVVYNTCLTVSINKQNFAYLHTPPFLPKKNTQAFFSIFLI